LDSTGSGQGPVAGCCECGDEPSGSCATELVNNSSSGSSDGGRSSSGGGGGSRISSGGGSSITIKRVL
jgi:hypothetical protein